MSGAARRRAAALAAAGLLAAGGALAACPPPGLVLEGVQRATRIQVEQLDSDATRIDTPLAHVPGRTLGYEVEGVFRVSGAAAAALQRAFGRRDSYACAPGAPRADFGATGPLAVGLLFASRASTVAVVLHVPEGMVEIQLEGGAHSTAPLSREGQRRWERALGLLGATTRTSPGQFYEQMRPPGAVPAAPAPAESLADSAGARRDEVRAPR